MGLIGCTTQNDPEPDLLGLAADSHCVVFKVPEIQMQFRMHDYYMGVLNHPLAEYPNHINPHFRNVLEYRHNLW